MTILVLGSNGMLGNDLVKVLQKRNRLFVAASRKDADVTDMNQIAGLLDRVTPVAVINCTAMHDSAKCEEDPGLAMNVNCISVFGLAKLCAVHHAKLLTISTDYVFDGKKEGGYTEADIPNPLMWYGRSKLAGEWAAQAANPKTFIVRTQSLYGYGKPTGKRLHFVDLIQKMATEKSEISVNQLIMSPTWTYPLAEGILNLLETERYGLYHMSCQEPISWYTFACEIIRLKNLKTKIVPVEANFFPSNFSRPQNSYLINHKLKELGIDQMPTWREALKEYIS